MTTWVLQSMSKGSVSFAHIDQVIDSTSGCETLCFLDAYSGYHQIMMKESDQLTMSFSLKNVGATYQHCMLKCFRDLIGQTVEAYIDDIVVKSKWADHLIVDLEQTFAKL